MSVKIILRKLYRQKVYAAINITGVAVGMAGAIIIFQLVSFHLSVDKYHLNAEKTYRVVVDLHLDDGQIEKERGSAFVLHNTLKKEFSYVENAAYLASREVTVDVRDGRKSKKFLEKGSAAFTGTDFFKIFDYHWTQGSPAVLNLPNQVVLTESYALKYFGNTNPIGKFLRIDNQENVRVAGIFRDYPQQTDFKKDIFISLPTIRKLVPDYGYEDWQWIDSGRETYVTLRSEKDRATFEKQMPAFAKKYYGDNSKYFHYHLQPLSDVHFNMDYKGQIKYSTIVILATVALLMVLIACFNFINLSTAHAFKRSKEVGVRKVLGVSQTQIFWSFIRETAVLTLCSTVLALILAVVFSAVLKIWLGLTIEVNYLSDYRLPVFTVLLVLLILLLAGVYPALIVSSFNPLRAIKGLLRENNHTLFSVRKGLVVTQFSISFVLIAVALLIMLQSDYISKKDLGMDKDLIMHIRLPTTENDRIEVIRNEVVALNQAEGFALFRGAPSSQEGYGGSIKFENRDWEKFPARSKVADENYIAAYGLRLVAGRNVVKSDTVRELLVNQKMVRALGLKSPDEALGKNMVVGEIGKSGRIVGVLADFNNTDLYSAIEPTVVYQHKAHYRYAAIKFNHVDKSTVESVAAIWQRQFPDHVFEYSFFDEELAGFYKREELASGLISLFAGVSVFLSCLGLFGLAIFSIEQRTKEIGIRKVLGASVAGIIGLLSADFLKLVLVAIVLASPVAYYFMDRWLQDFAYKISIEWWIFASAGLAAAGIALLTISFQSIKAALKDPVESLRSE
ncbi:ABC transporter permease [Dyadobacter aurulentus]|uniref:ABC transporter permease n=1 Tax=Dyadobacter sp. UC 10 TaxID=2605428 RepID=UPI0011F3CD61|nr:ABC transporter permease [Dyadobacter sp. UC 10]KAA0989589.1 FtsX-like permease family protein [Dyadobacter sp. UC 10]